jgi:hypothetical protein
MEEGSSIRCRSYGAGRLFSTQTIKISLLPELSITATDPVREAGLCFILVAKVVVSFFSEPAILSIHFLR